MYTSHTKLHLHVMKGQKAPSKAFLNCAQYDDVKIRIMKYILEQSSALI